MNDGRRCYLQTTLASVLSVLGCLFAAWQLCQALWISRVNNLNSFVTVQPCYNLFDRRIETELVPCCQTYSIGIIPFAPLAMGFLTGKYRKGQEIPTSARLSRPALRHPPVMTEAEWKKLTKLETFATENGHTVGELALAWLIAKPCVSTVIVGVHKPDHVIANAAAASWKLTAEQVTTVDAIS
ncbi:aldo/keto reductase [Chloroflexota bacterium]